MQIILERFQIIRMINDHDVVKVWDLENYHDGVKVCDYENDHDGERFVIMRKIMMLLRFEIKKMITMV